VSKYIAVRCSALHLRFVRVIRLCGVFVLQCVAVCRSALQCVAVQCVAFVVCARDRCVCARVCAHV